MIKVENGKTRYFDRNGVEITEGCEIKYLNGDKTLQRVVKVYRTENDELGTDATNQSWVESGKALPCEYGVYPFSADETEEIEVIEV